ncbi:HD domain-containing protein [Crossiella sp. SN42]|uniref:HD domain-containing protein n=1 Tax=Crossiella sp. SN42 TaxID=2944808 RepID=UPI00207D07B1|nr:HD domain-containing protein [Crossiella sp. SN42]MCO1581235.1 HD domain-containing protein [Crossiella sp. SN42]
MTNSRAVDFEALTNWEMSNSNLVDVARETATGLLSSLDRRWRHVQGVAARSNEIRRAVHCPEFSHEQNQLAERLLVASAWLHDIGYSPELSVTRLHAVDGATYLRERGFPEKIVNLVAHHSGARFEAEERGLADLLSSHPFKDDIFSDALATADLTTSPDGEYISYNDRIDEVLTRYSPDNPVHKFWLKARPVIGDAITRTEQRLSSYPK